MPSDPRIAQVLSAFAPQIDAYRSTVAATIEDLRGRLAAHGASGAERSSELKRALGPFAEGHVDAARLAALTEENATLMPDVADRLHRAHRVLDELSRLDSELFHVVVSPGADLAATVRTHLAAIGRVFAAARLAAGTGDEGSLTQFPHAKWSAAERRTAPPVVISVQGEDLHGGALAEFLDGNQKIALLVDGPCAPAPLVRLVTPGVWVMQSAEIDGCAQLAQWPGAGVVAVVGPACATFVHDPSAGPELWQRVTVQQLPTESAAGLASISMFQQVEELRQLEALAHHPRVASGAGEAVASAPEPVDRLAAWLVQQAHLTDLGGN